MEQICESGGVSVEDTNEGGVDFVVEGGRKHAISWGW